MMAANIAKDITFRATMENQVERGAKSTLDSVKKTTDEASRITIDAEKKLQAKLHQQAVDAETKRLAAVRGIKGFDESPTPPPAKPEGGSSAGHWGRLFSDQKTTGMGPLGRAISGGIAEHMETGIGIGVVAVVGAALSHATEGAVAFNEKIKDGRNSAAGIALDLGKSIPILGSFVSAGENIKELLTGERYELKMINDTLESRSAFQDKMFQSEIALSEKRRANAAEQLSLAHQLETVNLRGNDAELKAGENKRGEDAQAVTDADKNARDARAKRGIDIGKASIALDNFDEEHRGRMEYLADRQAHHVFNMGDPTDREGERQELEALTEARENLNKQRTDLQKLSKAQYTADLGGVEAGKIKVALDDATNAKMKQLRDERLGLERRGDVARDTQSLHGVDVENMRTRGDVSASRRYEIQAQTQDAKEQAKLDAEGQMNATTDAEERQQIAKRLADRLIAITLKGNADLAAADKDSGLERTRIQWATAEAEGDAASAAEAQRLREAGQGYEAERVLRQRELQRKKDDIDRAATEQIALNRDNADAIRAKAAADKSKLDTDFKDQDRQRRESQRSGEFSTGKQLLDGRVSALQEEAKYGNIAAAAEAKKLEIASEYASKREELNKLIRDPNVNAAEKQLAQSQLAGLDAQEARAQKFANFTGGSRMPSLVMAGRSSGAAMRANEELSPFIQLARMTADQKKTIEQMQKDTAALVKVFQANPQVAALFNFKPGGR